MAREQKLKLELIVDDKGSVTVGQFGRKVQEGAAKSAAAWKRASARIQGHLGGIGKVAKRAGIGLAALGAAGGAAMIAITKSAANAGDNFQKMADRVGVSVEALSGLAHAAELSGTDITAVESGLRLLSKRMLDSESGLAEAKRSFEALGISVTDSSGNLRAADTVMMEIADKLAVMEDKTKAVALSQEIFGRSGTALLPMLKQGSAAIQKMKEEAEALGLVWTKEMADAAAQFNDDLTRLTRTFGGVKNQIGQALMPVMTEMAQQATAVGLKVVAWVKANKGLINTELTAFLKNLVPIIKWVVKWVGETIVAVNGMAQAYRDSKDTIAAVLAIVKTEIRNFKAIVIGVWEGLERGVSRIVKAIADAIDRHLFQRFRDIADKVGRVVDRITGFFGGMYDAVVGHSYVPEMIRGIEGEFRRLEGVMVTPAERATGDTVIAFRTMTTNVKELWTDLNSSLERAFSDTFFSAIKQDLTDLSSIWQGFLDSMLRSFVDILARMATIWATSEIGSLFGLGTGSGVGAAVEALSSGSGGLGAASGLGAGVVGAGGAVTQVGSGWTATGSIGAGSGVSGSGSMTASGAGAGLSAAATAAGIAAAVYVGGTTLESILSPYMSGNWGDTAPTQAQINRAVALASLTSGAFGYHEQAVGHAQMTQQEALAVLMAGNFDTGTPYVPRDMIAGIHQGERILTATENRDLVAAMNRMSGGGSAGAGVVIHNVNLQIKSSLDLRNPHEAREVARVIKRELRAINGLYQ